MRQIFDIGDRVITWPLGARGVVINYTPSKEILKFIKGDAPEYTVKLDVSGGYEVAFHAWNELTREPLSDTVGEMRAGDGVVTNAGKRGTVSTPLMVGSYAEHTPNPNDTPKTVVGVRCKMYDGTTMDLHAGQFRRERFWEFLIKRPGMFGRWKWKQAALRYAAFVAMVPMGLLMDFDALPWFGYALAGFGVLGMGLMTWGHWRNYHGKQA